MRAVRDHAEAALAAPRTTVATEAQSHRDPSVQPRRVGAATRRPTVDSTRTHKATMNNPGLVCPCQRLGIGLQSRPTTRRDRTPLCLCVSVAPFLCVLFFLCALGNAEAAIDDFLGKPVASVRLVIEGRETVDPSLARVVETREGEPLTMAAVRDTITHLFSLGRFDDVRVDATVVAANRVSLRYELSPIHPVTRIAFEGELGGAGVDASRLRRAVVDRYGPSPPLGRAAEAAG